MKSSLTNLLLFAFTVLGLVSTIQTTQADENIGNEQKTNRRELSALSDFLERFEVCEKVGPNAYKTVRLSRVSAILSKLRGRATDGPCEECPVLCKHEVCKGDFEVSLKDGSELCTCLEGTEVKDSMCGGHSTCSNDVCSCLSGFVGDATVACVDIDECSANPCGANAKCSNSDGSFTCECMEGYTGDALAGCVDLNECDASNLCGDNTSCINSDGTFECKCLEGYEGDPKVGCTDINECSANTTICSDVSNSVCTNVPGSYECLCRKDYELNPTSNKCLSSKLCWGDGELCQYGSTCNKCCKPATYWWDRESYACSFNQPCWEDGKDCIPGVTCELCCNEAYDNQGTKCGGSCLEKGVDCGFGTTCDLCCDGFSWKNNSAAVCGADDCWEDGTKCTPSGSCGQCCNDAFADQGRMCGGECWINGRLCDDDTTCELCCEFPNFWSSKNATACGKPPCLLDGVKCEGDECENCCNTAYDDNGKTCGGECWKKGETCQPFETCNLCCGDYNTYLPADDKVVCGRGNFTECLQDGFNCTEFDVCWQCCTGPFGDDKNICGGVCIEDGKQCKEDSTCDSCCNGEYYFDEEKEKYFCGYEPFDCLKDGTPCIPGQDCYECCNGAYLDGGYTCGGECIEDGTQCAFGVDCHLCCSWSNYWFSNNNFTCGLEECFEDGTSCIPGESCEQCCNGHYDDNGFTCGGTCLFAGEPCDIFSTCEKCCSERYIYNDDKQRIECAGAFCLEDGESCIPYQSCYECCSGNAYLDNGLTCGGECLPGGTECNYYSTCNQCCTWPEWDEKLQKYFCFEFNYDDDRASDDDYYQYDDQFPFDNQP